MLQTRGKVSFVLIILIFMGAACSTSPSTPSISPTEIENTFQAEVNRRLTELAPTPNLDATIDARLTEIAVVSTETQRASATRTPTSVPISSNEEENIDKKINQTKGILGVISIALSIIIRLWNFLGQFGIVAQITCVGIPILTGLVATLKR